MSAHHLDPEKIIETVATLRNRIRERFPDAGLATVADDLLNIARDAQQTGMAIKRPMYGVRLLSFLIIIAISACFVMVIKVIRIPNQPLPAGELVQALDAGFNALVLIGATVIFLMTLETRVKRSRTVKAIHRLRSLVHIIDMHQLTKDPERVLTRDPKHNTLSSPKRMMDRFLLNRYLDYCSEMLALCGKIAAVYVDEFSDPQAVAVVNDLENLTTGLGRKIWQKIMILHSFPEDEKEKQTAPSLTGDIKSDVSTTDVVSNPDT
ncbi:hypothetical protein AB1L42_08085 [Thalassoglobus sp. JC818]|uniref:hypothetical protein n=1 Tax=Thalassoglobus sp. JC818 TaxID=3232136 RepID=UPI00345A816D